MPCSSWNLFLFFPLRTPYCESSAEKKEEKCEGETFRVLNNMKWKIRKNNKEKNNIFISQSNVPSSFQKQFQHFTLVFFLFLSFLYTPLIFIFFSFLPLSRVNFLSSLYSIHIYFLFLASEKKKFYFFFFFLFFSKQSKHKREEIFHTSDFYAKKKRSKERIQLFAVCCWNRVESRERGKKSYNVTIWIS